MRKRCKHAEGLSGAVKMRAWRKCGCVWGVDLYIDGERKWHKLGHEERTARVAYHRLIADYEDGRRVRRVSGQGFRELAEDWYAAKQAVHGARPGSIASYRARIDHAVNYLGDIPVKDIRQEHLNRLVEDITNAISSATAANVASVVGAVLTHAAHLGIDVPHVTFRGLLGGRNVTKQGHTVAELATMIAGMAEPWGSMAEFALLTGLRRGEILALHVDDVEDAGVKVTGSLNIKGEVGPTKTRSGTRLVTLSPRTQVLVAGRVKAVTAGRLWPYTLTAASDALRTAMQAAGIYREGKCWHSLRHAHTALLNETGISLRDAAARLGHGANYAQSLAYGWASEQVDASVVDEAVRQHSDS